MRVAGRRLWWAESRLEACAQTTRAPSDAHFDTLVPLARSHPGDGELTVYLKGFLSPCEKPDDFSAYHASHLRLHAEQKWGLRAYGYTWEKGQLSIAVPVAKFALPIPVATISHVLWALWSKGRILRIASPTAAVGLIAAELTFSMVQIVRQYFACRASLDEQAKIFAAKVRRLQSIYSKVRLVGHSMGCALLVKTLQELEPWEREALECHFLAPAVLADDCVLVLPELKSCCVYYTQNDWILAGLFGILHLSESIGTAGSRGLCRDLDVSELTRGVFVHREFPKLLPDMVALAARQTEKPLTKS